MIKPRCTCGGIGLLKEMGSGSVAVILATDWEVVDESECGPTA